MAAGEDRATAGEERRKVLSHGQTFGPRCVLQVRSASDESFDTLYDAEAPALAAAAGGRRAAAGEDRERRKGFAHSSTRKRK